MEKLSIQNFVGIKKLEIELTRINILIGPQATGKSVCAKLSYYFKSFIQDMFSSVEKTLTKRELDSSFIKKFESYFPAQSWGTGKFKIRYEINEYYIEICRPNPKQSKLHLHYSDIFKTELNKLRRHFKQLLKRQENDFEDEYYDRSRSFYKARLVSQNIIKEQLGTFAGNSQLFIPAGRSFFANLQSSIFSFLSSNKAIDPFLTEFGSFYENVKNYPISRRLRNKDARELDNKINKLVEEILRGKHLTEKGKDYLISSDTRRTNIINASSGQQEMLPLAIILRMIPHMKPWGAGYTVYIEEPEAHLFPSAQKTIVELIATIFNNSSSEIQFFITTHSPYILTSFNNLLHAGSLYEKLEQSKKVQINEVIPKDQALLINDVKSYSLSNGECIELQCNDCGLVTSDIIDAVSDDLAIEFDKLLNIESR